MDAGGVDAIPVQPWMRAPETLAVMRALEAAGGAGCARFVGGCVRNVLVGRPVDDVDIATTLAPEAVIRAIETAGLKAVPTGLDHGTVTAVAKGRPFEITTLRRDVETDGRRAVVAFTTDWAEDAQRRDFRLNAVYADLGGRLFDPTGAGAADARAGRIVFVGDADTRIREDALRILRFYRFWAWYGRGEPDTAGLAACAARADLLAGLSAERVSKELLKLLAAEDPRAAVRLMDAAGVLARILPEAAARGRFERVVAIDLSQALAADPVLRLAALLPDDAAAGLAAARRLRLSNAERDRLEAALGPGPRPTAKTSPREVRRAVYGLGAETFCDRARLAWAGSEKAPAAPWRALLELARSWSPPAPPFGGEAVVAAGVPRGPKVGAVLRTIEAWWIDNDFTDDKEAAAERLKAIVAGMGLSARSRGARAGPGRSPAG